MTVLISYECVLLNKRIYLLKKEILLNSDFWMVVVWKELVVSSITIFRWFIASTADKIIHCLKQLKSFSQMRCSLSLEPIQIADYQKEVGRGEDGGTRLRTNIDFWHILLGGIFMVPPAIINLSEIMFCCALPVP